MADRIRRAILEKDVAQQLLIQAVVQTLEALEVSDEGSLVERIGGPQGLPGSEEWTWPTSWSTE